MNAGIRACPYCGKCTEIEGKFCPYCGREMVKNNGKKEKVDFKNKKKQMGIWWIMIIILLILIGLFLYKKIFFPKTEELKIEKVYINAIGEFEKKNYEEALSLLETINEYKEAKQYIEYCRYGILVEKIEKGEYDQALADIDTISWINCDGLREECYYQKGIEAYEKGKYNDAMGCFKKLNNWNRVEEQCERIVEHYISVDALDEAISLLECLEYSEKRELQIEELKYKRKYQNYKTDGFENLLYSFEPYTDIEELERDLSINYYGTWYANDSTENFEYGKYLRNGREYAIYSAFKYESPIIIYYYLDKPGVYYAEGIDYVWLTHIEHDVRNLVSMNFLDSGLKSTEYSYFNLDSEELSAVYSEEALAEIEYNKNATIQQENSSADRKESLYETTKAKVNDKILEWRSGLADFYWSVDYPKLNNVTCNYNDLDKTYLLVFEIEYHPNVFDVFNSEYYTVRAEYLETQGTVKCIDFDLVEQ